jgi:hypothetical protein
VNRGRTAERVQVIGERNSATNYVIELIESNFDVEMERGVDPAWFSLASQRLPWAMRERASDLWLAATRTVWKHAFLDERSLRRLERTGVEVVAVVKHPLSWMLSTHRRPYHRGEEHADLVEFATTPWRTVGRERLGQRTYANGFELWATKAAGLVPLADDGRIVLWRFEDVLIDEAGHLAALAARLGQPEPATVVGVPENTKSQHGITQTHAEIRDYYLSEAWRAEVPEAVRRQALESCGDVVARLGYEI